MKIIIDTTTLLKAVNPLYTAVSPNGILPVLSCFGITATNNGLTIVATNEEFSVSTLLDKSQLQINDYGSININAKMLIEFLKTLKNEPITITSKEGFVEIKTEAGKYKISCDANDFPPETEITDGSNISLPLKPLVGGLNKVLWSVGTDDLRPAMCGVLFSADTDGYKIVSTSGFVLSEYKQDFSFGYDKLEINAVIPKKVLQFISKQYLDADDSHQVIINVNDTKIEFITNDYVIRTVLISALFPNYAAVIPQVSSKKATVDVISLRGIFSTLRYYSGIRKDVVLTFESDKLGAIASDNDYSLEATETTNCIYNGEPISIGLNSDYVLSCLSNFQDNVVFHMEHANRSVLIQNEKYGGYQVLIMPVMQT